MKIASRYQKGKSVLMACQSFYVYLAELGLTVNQEKSKVVYGRKEPFTFLAYEFIGEIRQLELKKEKTFKKRVKDIISQNQTVNVEKKVEPLS